MATTAAVLTITYAVEGIEDKQVHINDSLLAKDLKDPEDDPETI